MARYRAGKRLWEPEDDAILRARFPDETTASLANVLGRSAIAVSARAALLGLHKSQAYLDSPAACRLHPDRGPHPGLKTQYPKGHVPANKGKRRPGWHRGRMRETQFKKGESAKSMPIGATRLIDGYVYRKVSAIPHEPYTTNWKAEHVLVWTAVNGPIPPGHALKFKNGDRQDIRLDNLTLITRRELMLRNTLHNLPAPLKRTIHMLGAVNRAITMRRRKEQHAEQQD